MNKPLTIRDLLGDALDLKDDVLQKLLLLAERIALDQQTGTLKITNGKSSITLRENGEIRVSGTRDLGPAAIRALAPAAAGS